MQNKKNLPGHFLRELHRFLERNQKTRRTKKQKKHTHTHRTKKHAEQTKNTLTVPFTWLAHPFLAVVLAPGVPCGGDPSSLFVHVLVIEVLR